MRGSEAVACELQEERERFDRIESALATALAAAHEQWPSRYAYDFCEGVLARMADEMGLWEQRPRGYAKAVIPEDLRWRIYKRDGYACVACGSDSRLTVDHLFAEIRGGTLDEENLQTLCRSCNSSKGTR